MRPSAKIYDSPRLAESYASSRPPLHPLIVDRIAARLGIHERLTRALDVGCGVGLSTVPLATLARTVVGFDGSLGMVGRGRRLTSEVAYTASQAEAMPFKAESFDLVTAAGVLNYADLDRFFPEATRVMTADARLVVYDFGSGRRFQHGPDLDTWFASFEGRYPFPPGYALDVGTLPYSRFGLALELFDEFDLVVSMTLASYFDYAMTETNVEQAILAGTAESEIRAWCLETLAPLFEGANRQVVFPAYIACIHKARGVS